MGAGAGASPRVSHRGGRPSASNRRHVCSWAGKRVSPGSGRVPGWGRVGWAQGMRGPPGSGAVPAALASPPAPGVRLPPLLAAPRPGSRGGPDQEGARLTRGSPSPELCTAKEVWEEDPIDFNYPQTAHRDKGLWLFMERPVLPYCGRRDPISRPHYSYNNTAESLLGAERIFLK